MTEDAPSTGPGTPPGTPNDPPPAPPALAPADASGDRPPPAGVAPAPPPPPATPPVQSSDKPGRPGMGLLPVVLGVGLLAAAAVVSATRSRSDGDLDWSNYGVGLAATGALLLIAVVALVVGRDQGRENLVTWPGATGALAAGVMVGLGLEDVDGSEDWLPYLVGGVVVLLSVAGYAAVRRGAFAVTAILGLGVAYLKFADDVLVDIGDDDDRAIIAAVTIAVFVLVVTAVGWLLRARALIGVVAGVIGLVGINAVLGALVFAQTFAPLVGMEVFGAEASADPFSRPERPNYDNDVYVILAVAAVLTLLWALAAAVNGNPGFAVLAIAMPATVVPLATFVLAVEHPTWWGVGFAVAGGVLLALVTLRQLLTRKQN